MKITALGNGKVAIDTPYNPQFVERLKLLGAKWNATKQVWTADERSKDSIRQAMMEVYGRTDEPCELVDIKITLEQELEEWRGQVFLFGRCIARATSRDSGARVGEGVEFEQGKPRSGGSVKYWTTKVPAGSVIVLRDVAKGAVEGEVDWQAKYGSYVVLDKASDTRQRELLAEQAQLVKRLAEIETELATLREEALP